MDANGSRYHALVSADDWRARVPPVAPPVQPRLAWSEGGALVLRPLLFEFKAAKAGLAALPEPGPRGGGVFDAFGNLYALASDGLAIRIRSSGSGAMSDFWPLPAPDGAVVEGLGASIAGSAAAPAAVEPGAFGPVVGGSAQAAPLLDALAVTTGHYLVALSEAAQGLLIFDLHGGGPPLFQSWPDMPRPERLQALDDGGLALLSAGWLHRLGPDLRPCVPADTTPALFCDSPLAPEPGAPAAMPPAAPPCLLDLRPALGVGSAVQAFAVLPGQRLLVLGQRAGEDALRLGLIGLDGAVLRVCDASAPTLPLGDLNGLIGAVMVPKADGGPADPPALSLRTMALETRAVARRAGQGGPDFHVLLIAAGGDQAFRFAATWHAGGSAADPQVLLVGLQRDYLPLRRYQGGGLASLPAGMVMHAYASARAFYLAATESTTEPLARWVPLLALPQPRYEREAELTSPVWDSGLPACVWHRVVLDARRPPGCSIRLQSRAADAEDDLLKMPWRDEPALLAHPRGPELPWRALADIDSACADVQSLTALLQDARGRFAQLRLLLAGDGQQSPALRALRVWYPRFSYLHEYLPAIYRADETSASFTDRLLALFEGEFTRWEDRIAAAQLLLDARSAPPDTLEWLAGWVALAFDASTTPERRRLLLRHAMSGHARRGTVPGLLLAASLAWYSDAADDAQAEAWLAAPESLIPRQFTPEGVRLQEMFGLTPPLPAAAWRPAQGAAALLATLLGDASLIAGDSTRASLLQSALGFVPRGAQEEEALRTAWSLATLPDDWPRTTAERTAYAAYLAASQACAPLRQRWQDFLARRWRRIGALNAAWGTRWRGFEQLPSFTRVPGDGPALADWHLFESQVVRAMANAHRFRIVLPLPSAAGPLDIDELGRRRTAVLRAIERDRPAHTVAELRFGFELFRVGEARLGLDTRLEHGLTRRPELAALGASLSAWPPMVLNQNDLGGAQLSSARPLPPSDRIGLDRGA